MVARGARRSRQELRVPGRVVRACWRHYVVPDFAWVQDVGGSLIPIAEQVRRAVAWVHRNAKSFGGDPSRIYVSGHSSGGHLAGVILTTDWPKDFNLPVDTVKGGLFCSGMFDLKPVRLSARSKYVTFTDEMEQALSPQRHLDKLNAPVLVAYGTLESPEFQRQSRDFAAAVKAAGQVGPAPGRRRLQPFRNHRNAQQSIRTLGPRGSGADAARKDVTRACMGEPGISARGDAEPLHRPERPRASLLGSRRASRAGARSCRSFGGSGDRGSWQGMISP